MEPIRENDAKEQLETQFQELLDKAKKVYPDINQSLATYNNAVAKTEIIQNFINLSTEIPNETSNNQTSL